MAGAPVRVPGSPASATGRVPSTVPSTMAVRPAASDSSGVPVPPGWSTKIAPVKPSRLTPRLPHSPSWSKTLSACGTGSASVWATSEWRSPRTVTKVPGVDVGVDVAVMTASLRRHYPVRFRRSVAQAEASHPLSPVSPSSRVGVPILPRSVDKATEPFRAVGSGRHGWQTGRRWRRPRWAAPPPGQVGGGRSWPRAWRCHAGEGGSWRCGHAPGGCRPAACRRRRSRAAGRRRVLGGRQQRDPGPERAGGLLAHRQRRGGHGAGRDRAADRPDDLGPQERGAAAPPAAVTVVAAAAPVRRAAAVAQQAGPGNGGTTHVHVGNPWPLLVFFAVAALAAAALTLYRRRRAMPTPPRPDADP